MNQEPSPRKTGQHHGDLRGALVEAALAIVGAGEVATLSLREVARRAGVSSAAPYHHFADKEHLLAAVAVEGFEQLAAVITRALAGSRSPRARVARMTAAYVRFAVAHGAHYRIMFGPALGDAAAHPALEAASRASFQRLAEHVALAGGLVAPAAIQERAALAWAFTHGVVELALSGLLDQLGGVPPIDALADEVGEKVADLAVGKGGKRARASSPGRAPRG